MEGQKHAIWNTSGKEFGAWTVEHDIWSMGHGKKNIRYAIRKIVYQYTWYGIWSIYSTDMGDVACHMEYGIWRWNRDEEEISR